MGAIRTAIVIVAICGPLVHFVLSIDSTVGKWPEFFEHFNKYWGGHMFGLGWISMPFIAFGIGQVALRSVPALTSLLFFAIALIALDVVWYTAENSKDWYVVLSPIVLTAISVVCLLLSIGVQHIAAPNRTAKTDSRKGTARGSP